MNARTSDPRVHSLFVDRWSPRSFDGSDISDADLETILNAARLAPSAYNYQPWTFLYSRRGDANWERFLSLLIPFNASWAQEASVLVFIVSDRQMRKPDGSGNPNHSHSFDAGAAWAQMALQATALGFHAHGMTGIEFGKAEEALGIPDDYRLEAAAVIGRRAEAERLPEGLREREAPSDRKGLDEIAHAGVFPG